jgi:hypothetical protein
MSDMAPTSRSSGTARPRLNDPSTVEACFELLAPRARQGHERVLLSILLDAVIQLQRRGTMSAAAAARWIRGEEGMGGPTMSFGGVCNALQIDADELARGLLRGSDTAGPTIRVIRARLRVVPQTPTRDRPSAIRNRPLLFLWMLLLAAIVRAPWWARAAVGASLVAAVVCLGYLVAP